MACQERAGKGELNVEFDWWCFVLYAYVPCFIAFVCLYCVVIRSIRYPPHLFLMFAFYLFPFFFSVYSFVMYIMFESALMTGYGPLEKSSLSAVPLEILSAF